MEAAPAVTAPEIAPVITMAATTAPAVTAPEKQQPMKTEEAKLTTSTKPEAPVKPETTTPKPEPEKPSVRASVQAVVQAVEPSP